MEEAQARPPRSLKRASRLHATSLSNQARQVRLSRAAIANPLPTLNLTWSHLRPKSLHLHALLPVNSKYGVNFLPS